jgi:hypothetical protein
MKYVGGRWVPKWVKLRRTQCEHMFSDFLLKADIDWFSHPQWTAKRQSAPRGVHDKKVQG